DDTAQMRADCGEGPEPLWRAKDNDRLATDRHHLVVPFLEIVRLARGHGLHARTAPLRRPNVAEHRSDKRDPPRDQAAHEQPVQKRAARYFLAVVHRPPRFSIWPRLSQNNTAINARKIQIGV